MSIARYFFKKYIREQVRQGNQSEKITALYREIYLAAKKEYYEDNTPTLGDFLLECFENGMASPDHPFVLTRGWYLNNIGWKN